MNFNLSYPRPTCLALTPRSLTRLPFFSSPHQHAHTESFLQRKQQQHLTVTAAAGSLLLAIPYFTHTSFIYFIPLTIILSSPYIGKTSRILATSTRCPRPREDRRPIPTTLNIDRCRHLPRPSTYMIDNPTITCHHHMSATALRHLSIPAQHGRMVERSQT